MSLISKPKRRPVPSGDLSETTESEARYRGLLEAAPDAMVVVNVGGEIVLLNAQAEKQFGYRRDELVGQQVTNIIPEGFAERLIADGTRSAADALAQHIGTGIELSARRKDGSEFPIEIMLSPLENAEGILVTAAIRDISVRKTAEKDLARMESRYRGLLEAAPDAMVVVNAGGEIVLVNAQAERRFGYRRDELVAQQVTSIIPKGFAERLIADGNRSAAEALAQQIGTGIELVGRRKDGSGFPIEIMLSPLESSEGILVTAAIRDISARKLAEKYMARMEGRYRGLLEAAPDAMVVVNPDGEIVLVNAQAERRFGYRRDELLGQRVQSIIPSGFAERLVADGERSAADALAQQIGTGIELVGKRKDGSEFPIEIMLSPLESAEGILITAAIRDITVRMAADRHLAQMESRYRGLLEAAPDAMVVVNVGGEIVLLNAQAEKQFGYRRDELLGQQVTNIIPEGFAERLVADGTRSIADARAQQIGAGIELVGRRKDRSEFPIEIMLSPLQSAEGTLVTAAIRNISERRHMEEQLRQSQKVEAIGRLAGGVAHDFNNLLGVILGYGELAEAELGKESPVRQHVAEMMVATQRAASLTRQLQAFSRKQILQPKLLDLNDLVANAHKMLARVIGADLALVVRQAPELGTVRADPGQIDQILLNLAINARDAMPAGGTLTLETSNVELFENYAAEHWPVRAGRFVMLAVSDTGIGMDAETQRQIFEPFFTTKPVGQGTGLGLSTVYGIVQQSEGHIWVYSEPGLGTTFKIYFPRVEALPDISRPSPLAEVARGGHETILLVEDSLALRDVIRHRLEAGGYAVLLAGDGEEALALAGARTEPIDLLLTDVVMPKLGGGELARRLTALRPGLPVIFMSGYTDGGIERSELLTDRVMLIEKPFKGEALVRLVREILDRPSGIGLELPDLK